MIHCVLGEFDRRFGGMTAAVIDRAEALAMSGHDVKVQVVSPARESALSDHRVLRAVGNGVRFESAWAWVQEQDLATVADLVDFAAAEPQPTDARVWTFEKDHRTFVVRQAAWMVAWLEKMTDPGDLVIVDSHELVLRQPRRLVDRPAVGVIHTYRGRDAIQPHLDSLTTGVFDKIVVQTPSQARDFTVGARQFADQVVAISNVIAPVVPEPVFDRKHRALNVGRLDWNKRAWVAAQGAAMSTCTGLDLYGDMPDTSTDDKQRRAKQKKAKAKVLAWTIDAGDFDRNGQMSRALASFKRGILNARVRLARSPEVRRRVGRKLNQRRPHTPASQIFSNPEYSCLLVSSRYEGFGRTIVEAMSAGIVPICLDIKYGPEDIITDGVDGFIVRRGDSSSDEELAHRMAGAINRFERMGRSDRESIRAAAVATAGRYATEPTSAWLALLAELNEGEDRERRREDPR